MSAAQLPVHYHDVVGVAVIIGDEGNQPQEVFRYPFFNEGVCFRFLSTSAGGPVNGLMIMWPCLRCLSS